MSTTNSAILDQQWRAQIALEWWEHTTTVHEAAWERKERFMEPDRLLPRPYRPTDLRAVIELLLSAQAAEPGFDWPGAGQLRALLADPELDRERNVRLWVDVGGALVAFALVRSCGHLIWFARPSAQSDGLDDLIVEWATRRARELGIGTLRTEARSIETRRMAALARLGFVAQPGGSLRLSRSLSGADDALAPSETPA
ncbi:MAG: hypothetical protein ACRDID_14710, partial [Ktedonobacterales bacterium]